MFTRDFYNKFGPNVFGIHVEKFSHYNFLDLNRPNNARQQMPAVLERNRRRARKQKRFFQNKYRSFPLRCSKGNPFGPREQRRNYSRKITVRIFPKFAQLSRTNTKRTVISKKKNQSDISHPDTIGEKGGNFRCFYRRKSRTI